MGNSNCRRRVKVIVAGQLSSSFAYADVTYVCFMYVGEHYETVFHEGRTISEAIDKLEQECVERGEEIDQCKHNYLACSICDTVSGFCNPTYTRGHL